METGLRGKAAIVTGAASGIGLACSRALAAEGASVVCADLDRDGAVRAAEDVGGLGIAVDVTDPASCDELVSATTTRFGSLDVLVTCAGVFHATPFDQITVEGVAALDANERCVLSVLSRFAVLAHTAHDLKVLGRFLENAA